MQTCIAPMRESLLAARRELLETADQNVIKLNTQLSSLTGTPYSLTKDTKEVATSEESTSAGSECFFANQATQTTPVLSRRSSTRDLTKADNTFSAGSETSNRIAEIAHNLSGATESEGPTILGELSEGITELEEFLRLIDQPESKQKPGRPYMTQNEARTVERKPEYEDMKKEIRLMKSRLLSAGSFPAARPGT